MNIPKLSKNEKLLLYITVAVCIGVGFDRLVVNPITSTISNLNKEIDLEEKRLTKSIRLLAQEEQIKEENKKFTQSVRQDFSDEEAVSKLLSEIEQIAKDAAVSLIDIKPGKTQEEDSYKKYTIDLETETKINNLVDFIYQLEDSPFLLRVSNFSISPKERHSANLKVRLEITQILFL